MITPPLFLNSKIEQVGHTTFFQRCRPKAKREWPYVCCDGAHVFNLRRSGNNKDFTPPARFLEEFFTAQADCMTAILFSAGYWRDQSTDTN
jgi:hypothetical protein